MWGMIFSFLGGPVINGLISAYRERLKNINQQDEMALQLLQAEVNADIAARAEATKLLIAEQGHWYTACIRPLFALPFIIFEFKVIVISYFGATAIERVSKIFKR